MNGKSLILGVLRCSPRNKQGFLNSPKMFTLGPSRQLYQTPVEVPRSVTATYRAVKCFGTSVGRLHLRLQRLDSCSSTAWAKRPTVAVAWKELPKTPPLGPVASGSPKALTASSLKATSPTSVGRDTGSSLVAAR